MFALSGLGRQWYVESEKRAMEQKSFGNTDVEAELH